MKIWYINNRGWTSGCNCRSCFIYSDGAYKNRCGYCIVITVFRLGCIYRNGSCTSNMYKTSCTIDSGSWRTYFQTISECTCAIRSGSYCSGKIRWISEGFVWVLCYGSSSFIYCYSARRKICYRKINIITTSRLWYKYMNSSCTANCHDSRRRVYACLRW